MKYLDSKLGKGIARVAMASYLAGSVAGCATPQVTAFGYTLNNPNSQTQSYSANDTSYGDRVLRAQEAQEDDKSFCEDNTVVCIGGLLLLLGLGAAVAGGGSSGSDSGGGGGGSGGN
ncbi:hypothetical protein J4407_00570 [Candidatus Pacearchaeota archaeon]|nr:hypothetical protein [Candidatus Pacearchaeota archaeon]